MLATIFGVIVLGSVMMFAQQSVHPADLPVIIQQAVEKALAKQKAQEQAEAAPKDALRQAQTKAQEDDYELRFIQAAQAVAVACERSGGKRVAATVVFVPQANGDLQGTVGVACEYDVKDLTRKTKRK